jgi:uncharacterized membrane protein
VIGELIQAFDARTSFWESLNQLEERGSMTTKQKIIIVLALIGIVFWCFPVAWFLQWWSVLTLTTVGSVGTLTGCITFFPVLLLGNVLALIGGFRKELGKPRMGLFLFVLVANAVLIVTGITTIISTVNSLSSHTSLFTPQPEDILWDEWLMMFLIFVGPQLLAMGVAVFGLARLWKHSQQTGEPPETVETAEG